MLGSLIKYEFKVTYKKFFLLYALVLFFSFINRFMSEARYGSLHFMGIYVPFPGNAFSETVHLSFVVIYIILLMAVGILTIYIVVKRFYNSMFGNVGYLMNTIPVEPWKNILSKLAVAFVWLILGIGVAFTSVIILINDVTITETIKGIYEIVVYLFLDGRGFLTLTFIIAAITQQISNIMIVYCSLSIGQLFVNHRKIMAFTAFLIISVIYIFFVDSAYSICFVDHNAARVVVSGARVTENVFIIGIITNCIMFAATFAGTNFILKNRLNLE